MAMDEKKAMTLAPQASVPQVQGPTLTKWDLVMRLPVEEQMKMAEKALTAQAFLVQQFLENTDETDWDDFHGKPRLNEKGAHKGKRMCFLRTQIGLAECAESERDASGRLVFFRYVTRGIVSSPWGEPRECIGSIDSDHPIHCERKDDEGQKIKLPASQVNRSKVADHSATLCFTRGVTEELGLKRLTWADLEKATNGKVTQGRVNIASKKGKAGLPKEPKKERPREPSELAPTPESPPTAKPEPDQADALWTLLNQKAEAKRWSRGEFWAWLTQTLPDIQTPQSREEVQAVRTSLTVQRLQFLCKEIEKASDAAAEPRTEREPGCDD